MTLSDEELVRLAREYLDINSSVGGHELANAVLNRFEKKARKVSGWVIVNDIGHFGEWENFDEISEHCKSRGDGSFPIYVTGTEGIGPEDSTPLTEKREGREWTVYQLIGGGISSNPTTSFQSVPFRVSEILEGEGE